MLNENPIYEIVAHFGFEWPKGATHILTTGPNWIGSPSYVGSLIPAKKEASSLTFTDIETVIDGYHGQLPPPKDGGL